MSEVDNLIGKQFGDYKLTSKLASGGMSQIYMGVDVKLQRQAAVKILTPEMTAADEFLTQRFEREARAVAALEHDNIITIYQYGEQDGIYFLAMKYIPGKDLAQELRELRRAGKRMAPERALHILEQVASALDYAHLKGVIHRDIKPSNILIDQHDKAVLTDFGLALRLQVDQTLGTAFGTPRYISPEQAMASERAVAQSDIYSLAVIVFEMLTGEVMFKGSTPMEIALAHISETPPPPRSINPDIPVEAEDEILKALSKMPEDRHATATEFIEAIKRAYEKADEDPTAVQTPTPATASGDVAAHAPDRTPIFADDEMREAIEEHRSRVEKRQRALETEGTKPAPSPGERILKPFLVLFTLVAALAVIVVVVLVAGNNLGGAIPPTPSASALATGTAQNSALPAIMEPSDTPTATPTDTLTPTDTPTPSDTPTPTDTYTPTDTPTATNTFTPTHTPTNTNTPTITPTPSDTPTPTATFTPTPSLTPIILPEGELVTVLYNEQALVFRNDSSKYLDISNLRFTQGDLTFGQQDLIDTVLEPQECVIIVLQRPGVSVPADWECNNAQSTQYTRQQAAGLFWRNIGNGETFTIYWDEAVVATCDTVERGGSGECLVGWPAVTSP